MSQNIIKNTRVNEEYIHIKHKSGLTVLLYPMQGYSTAYAMFGTKYGSIDRSFKTNKDDDFVTVPDGIAHFLEHKLFENEEGDTFKLFAKTGASANAYTTFDRTCYLFSCSDHFEDSLKVLMEFVQNPYFTEETVQKEQGIIGQEIRMVNDEPRRMVYFNLLKALYENHPVNIEIAGTMESISEIDAQLLFRCYHTFYNLNNMVLVIAGNFEPKTAVKIVDETVKDCEDIEVIHNDFEENEEVYKKEIHAKAEIALPLFAFGYKMLALESTERLQAEIECEIINDILIGDSSTLYRKLYDSGLINTSFGSEVLTGLGYFANVFEGESRNPKEVCQLLKDEIKRLQENGIGSEEFETAKKALYGQCIRRLNSVEDVTELLLNSHFNDVGAYDMIETVANVTLSDVNQRIKMYDNDKSSISIVEPIR